MDVEDTLPISVVGHLKVKIHPKNWCKTTFTSSACTTEQVSVVVNPVLLTDAKYGFFKFKSYVEQI